MIPESERSTTLEPLAEGRAEWRPAVLADSTVVRTIEAVEGTSKFIATRSIKMVLVSPKNSSKI